LSRYFAVSAPGIVPYTTEELRGLDLPAQSQTGGAAFEGGLAALYRANLHLRTANRVIMRLGEFSAVGFAELRKRAARLAWERCLLPGQGVALRVTCHKSRLYHSDAVAERVAGAITDRLGVPPAVEKHDEESETYALDATGAAGRPPQLVLVRLLHDHCTISIDSSGDLLHRRGYRLATAKAPLRETLAAALLLAAGWPQGAEGAPAPLLDPFCGAGTIAIEAAQMALGIAPGLGGEHLRRFAFMDWPDFDRALWERLVTEAHAVHRRRAEQAGDMLEILASDRDAGAIEMAQANATRAGVADRIVFSRRAVSEIVPAGTAGWIVTNPPYGLRVGAAGDLRNLYAQFGNVLRQRFGGWQVAVLCSDRHLLHQMNIRLDTSLGFVNGGVAVTLGRGRV
jgi:putative N6-adenine-specific DNA methylase